LAELRNELARLPAVSEAKFRELRGAEDEVTRSQAALDAMAAGLEVLAADAPVAVDGTPLAVGGSVILSDDAEVTVGVGVRLRIRPGGGTSLAEARVRLTGSRDDLDRLTGALGIKTIAEAGEALASRRSLGAKIEAAEASLSDRQADELPARLAAAREALVSAEAERDRRSDGGGPSGGAEDLAAAERSLAEADRGEADARASRDGDAKSTADAEGRFARHVETIDQERRAAGDLRAQLKLLEETHGDAAARTERLRVAEAQLATASQAFAATQASLAELDAAHLAADLARLGRARETTTAAMNDARTRIAVARSSLRTDGIEDPRADLASAVARHDAATVRLDSARRRAEAVRLLDRLFSDQQRSLADRFTRPLAETISGYLACLFGGGARAAVVFHENEFAGLELTRTGGDESAFGFETLSGGAREQFAAAVRLAVAEVLSADFGGTLPVVFDDAFAYADPERVRTLQRMLDRAAERGLQVIVLSCNPADYAGLGATLVPLSA
jgi:DNA repair exonuclease SbcCD ATPase subunit